MGKPLARRRGIPPRAPTGAGRDRGGYNASVQDVRLVVSVFAVSLAYAVLRYNVFAGVDGAQVPVFITNKAISVASVVMLGISRVVSDKPRRKHLGLFGVALAALHVLLSLMLFHPAYLAKLYRPNGTMTAAAELSMLAGAIATVLLGWKLYATVMRPLDRQIAGTSLVRGLGRFTLVLVAAHVACIGAAGWLELAKWPGGLPPITLLSCLIALGFCVMPPLRRAGG